MGDDSALGALSEAKAQTPRADRTRKRSRLSDESLESKAEELSSTLPEHIPRQKRQAQSAPESPSSFQDLTPAQETEAPAAPLGITKDLTGNEPTSTVENAESTLLEVTAEQQVRQPRKPLTVLSFVERGKALFDDFGSVVLDFVDPTEQPPLLERATSADIMLANTAVDQIIEQLGDKIESCRGRKEKMLGLLLADAAGSELPEVEEAGKQGKRMQAHAASIKAAEAKYRRSAGDRARAIQKATSTLDADAVANKWALSTMQLLTELTELHAAPYTPAVKKEAPTPTPKPSVRAVAAPKPATPQRSAPTIAEPFDDEDDEEHRDHAWEAGYEEGRAYFEKHKEELYEAAVEIGRNAEHDEWERWRNRRDGPEQPSIAEYDTLLDQTRELKAQLFELQSCGEDLHRQWQVAASVAWEYGWRPSHVRYDAEGFELVGLDNMMPIADIFFERDLARMREHLAAWPATARDRLPIFRGLPGAQ